MKTRITELFGIKYPIIAAPMTGASDARLVAAVSDAGGLGILGVGHFTPEELREQIKEIRSQTDKPFGVNVVAGDPNWEENGQVVCEERVPIVSHGRGKPDWLLHAVESYKPITIPTVGSLRQALEVERDGADAIIVQGLEAGGHASYTATMVLLPSVTDKVKIPVVAAGGFCDGKGLAAALALGAEGISMGTRFALTQECAMHPAAKERYLQATEKDTVVSDKATGIRCRWLNTKLVQLLASGKHKVTWGQAISNVLAMSREKKIPLWKILAAGLRMRQEYSIPLREMGSPTAGVKWALAGFRDGDTDRAVMACGQVCCRINDLPTSKELIEQVVTEAEKQVEIAREKMLG